MTARSATPAQTSSHSRSRSRSRIRSTSTPTPRAATQSKKKTSADPYLQAFDATAAARAALKPEQLLVVNLDIPTAVSTLDTVFPRLYERRAAIVKVVPSFDVKQFDAIPAYALALGHAHSEWLVAAMPPEESADLYAEALTLRETLMVDVRALMHRRLLSEESLAKLSGSTGFRNVAVDLLAVHTLVRNNWKSLEGHTGVQPKELERAVELCRVLQKISGARDLIPEKVSVAADQRTRAFTLAMNAYDEARAALGFVRRREGDLETIAPNLYGGRSHATGPKDKGTTTSPTPVPPAVTPASTPTTGTGPFA